MKWDRRQILQGGLLAISAAPMLQVSGAPAATRTNQLDLSLVHPELRDFAAAIARHDAVTPRLSASTLPRAREGMSHAMPPLAAVPWQAQAIPGVKGQPDVIAYLINSSPGQNLPGILHMHGGGFVTGTARSAIPILQALAKDLGCVVVTVEYRLAPETDYRGSIEDNYTALKWFHANAAALGVDPTRIAVMGESAGGGHAALLALTAQDRGEISLAFQCLTYPMLDDRTGSSRPVPQHIGRLMHMPADNRFCWRAFMGVAAGGAHVPQRAVPARATQLAGLPPAFIGVGSLDLFVHEDVEYALRLNTERVNAELIVAPGAFHVFDGAPAPISRWFNQAKFDALRRGLGIPLA
jgi:acetyl esterase/lipase